MGGSALRPVEGMADPLEASVLSSIAGALVGALVGYRLGILARRTEVDGALFELVHKEMESILAHGRNAEQRGEHLWSSSDGFSDILRKGVLERNRHRRLRADIQELMSLDDKNTAAMSTFYEARENAIWAVLEAARVRVTGETEPRGLRGILRQQVLDNHFMEALAAEDKAKWVRRFDEIQGEPAPAKSDAIVKWGTLQPTPEQVYDAANLAVKDARADYLASSENLLKQARKIKGSTVEALRKV